MALSALSLLAVMPLRVTADTTGDRDAGYTYVSNIEGYYNMTLDYCEMIELIHEGGDSLATAKAIFMDGKNSRRSATQLRKYSTWASDVHTGEKGYDGLMKYFNASDHLSLEMAEAIENGQTELVEALMVLIRTKYYVHEIDAALSKIQFVKEDDTLFETMTADSNGFPHNLDEAWAIWAHEGSCDASDLASVVRKLARAAGSLAGVDGVAHYMMAYYVNEITYAGKNRMFDYANSTREDLLLTIDAFLAQAAVKYQVHAEACGDQHMEKAANMTRDMAVGLLEVFYEGHDEDHSEHFDAIKSANTAEKLHEAFSVLLTEQNVALVLGDIPPQECPHADGHDDHDGHDGHDDDGGH